MASTSICALNVAATEQFFVGEVDGPLQVFPGYAFAAYYLAGSYLRVFSYVSPFDGSRAGDETSRKTDTHYSSDSVFLGHKH